MPRDGIPITRWRNRDAAFADGALGIRAVLEDVQRLAVSTPHTPLYERALSIFEKQLGSEHPDTLTIALKAVALFMDEGQMKEVAKIVARFPKLLENPS